MQERLKALAELQKIDLEVAALRKSSEVHPKAMGELERELTAARSEVEAERAKLLDVERQRRTLEQNISDEKEKVRKWETRLAEQRSTREYAALAREIDIAKKANVTMAEELVELGKLQVQIRELAKAKEQQYSGRMGEATARLTELRGKIAGFEGQVRELETKRAEAAKAVQPQMLARYDQVRKRRSPALVTVVAGKCLGCNMSLPPQQYNTLKTTLETDSCPSCHRIICAPEALEPPAAKRA